MKRLIILSICFCSLSYFSVNARPAGIIGPSPTIPTQSDSIPQVLAVQTVHPSDNKASDLRAAQNSRSKPCLAYPNNIIRFTISNPLSFLKSRPNDQARVVIYANGKELKGLSNNWYGAVTAQMIAAGRLPKFDKTAAVDIPLKRNDTTQTTWNYLYSNKPDFFSDHIELNASIGWENMSALEKADNIPNTTIKFYNGFVMICYTFLFIILLAGFVYLAGWTNTIREGDNTSPFSLSQAQLLFWTTLIISAFIYTLVLTDMPTAMNESILLILGISLSTTGVATIIDSRFKQTNQTVNKQTYGFFRDVLTADGVSYSTQRIQVFAWNLVLGLYFIIYTIATKTMPIFSSTLLFLSGISSASYVGTKVPENNDLKTKQNPSAVDTTITPKPALPVG